MNSDDFSETDHAKNGDDIEGTEADSNRFGRLERFSSNGETIEEPVNAEESLTRLEFDLACCLEKLPNLNVLMMHVATMENEYELFASEKDHELADFAERVVEFDLLSGILDSEVKEMDDFMILIQNEINGVREMLYSRANCEEIFTEMQYKILDCENSLKQSQDQISEIRNQAATFQTTLSCFYNENWNVEKGAQILNESPLANANAKIEMQTAEQQRDILRMLERTMGREMDLENKLTESKQIEEDLRIRLQSSEQDLYSMEKEMEDVWERCFEAGNASEVFRGVSKELLGRVQILQFNLQGLLQREGELRSKLEDSTDQLKEKENDLIHVKSEAFALNEKVTLYEKQLKEYDTLHLEDIIINQNISIAESKSESAELKIKLLEDANMELNKELCCLKSSDEANEKVNLLEKELMELDILLQQAVASSEASQEKQILLSSTITDMENLIRDLKLKVLKEESRADVAEERCVVLSEAHSELNEEISFLRGKMNCLEVSLQEAEVTKMATAKDISFQTKIITDLVMRLAIERERLHKQISSLAMENKLLVVKLQGIKSKEFSKHELSSGTGANGRKKGIKPSTTDSELYGIWKTKSPSKTEAEETTDFVSESETVRRIDAGVLNMKHGFLALLILLVSVGVYFFAQQEDQY